MMREFNDLDSVISYINKEKRITDIKELFCLSLIFFLLYVVPFGLGVGILISTFFLFPLYLKLIFLLLSILFLYSFLSMLVDPHERVLNYISDPNPHLFIDINILKRIVHSTYFVRKLDIREAEVDEKQRRIIGVIKTLEKLFTLATKDSYIDEKDITDLKKSLEEENIKINFDLKQSLIEKRKRC